MEDRKDYQDKMNYYRHRYLDPIGLQKHPDYDDDND